MKKNENPTKETYFCECTSTHHQLVVTYYYGVNEYDFDEITFEVHLNQYLGFWKRLWHAIKYVCGYKSSYGDWDCFLLTPTDAERMIKALTAFKQDSERINENIQFLSPNALN